MDFSGPMDLLRAVNLVLRGMGETSVNSLTNASLDVEMAQEAVQESSYRLQTRGWHWNRETHTLSPDTDGNIFLPKNTAKVDSFQEDYYCDVVQRGVKLFNRTSSTYSFTKPIKVDLYVILQFAELNNTACIYIAADAAMKTQQQLIGSDTLDKDLAKAALQAWQDLVREDMESGDYNMLRGSGSVQGILQRQGYAYGGGR